MAESDQGAVNEMPAIRRTLQEIAVESMRAQDWPFVAAIYQEGIDTGDATFAVAPPASWAEWEQGKLYACSLVARAKDALRPSGEGFGRSKRRDVLGWAALSPISSRAVYAGVAEVSLYVAADARGLGIGSLLMSALVVRSEQQGIWTLQAGIFPENVASVRLHLKHGFREVGRRERMGRMQHGPHAGTWRDVLLLERRSAVIGID
jgi:phosphinothricin acetyltransferase